MAAIARLKQQGKFSRAAMASPNFCKFIFGGFV
jgi:hypothetical protein